MVWHNKKPAQARRFAPPPKQAPVHCLGNEREREDARPYLVSLRELPAALLTKASTFVCPLPHAKRFALQPYQARHTSTPSAPTHCNTTSEHAQSQLRARSIPFELNLGWVWQDVTDLVVITAGVGIFVLSINLILGA